MNTEKYEKLEEFLNRHTIHIESQKGATMKKVQRLHYTLAIDAKSEATNEEIDDVLSEISTVLRKAAEADKIRGSYFDHSTTEIIDEDIAFEE